MLPFASLTALIIEPNSGMRANMHRMLNQCGISNIEHTQGSGSAIALIKTKHFDLIICEYTLGDCQDGQQLLEDLRHHQLIALSTMFFIVTAECTAQKVVGAAELTPSGYILKPFTAEMVQTRLTKAIEQRASFLPVYTLLEQGSLRQAIGLCMAQELKYPHQARAFQRQRAQLHIALGEAQPAEEIYAALFEENALPWAGLGLAKAYLLQNRLQDAEELLTTLVAQNKNFLEAYDCLAKIYETGDQSTRTLEILEQATAISPHAVRRLRRLGEVADEVGNVALAEKAFSQVISKARFSEFRDPEDHVRLVRVLVAKNDTQQAAIVIRDLAKTIDASDKNDTCHALASALLHAHSGDHVRATTELQKALTTCRTSVGLSSEIKTTLAESCLAHDLEADATEIMLDVVGNTPSNRSRTKALTMLARVGRTDLVDTIAVESKRLINDLITSGAEKARQGDFAGAVSFMTQAVKKLPDNPQVVFNAAVAALKYLENVGWEAHTSEQAKSLIASARRLDPTNPRLTPLAELYRVISNKHSSKQTTAATTASR